MINLAAVYKWGIRAESIFSDLREICVSNVNPLQALRHSNFPFGYNLPDCNVFENIKTPMFLILDQSRDNVSRHKDGGSADDIDAVLFVNCSIVGCFWLQRI
jgi:hypothetical protein